MKKRSTRRKPIRAIDLFCGAGGSSWGAYKAGVKVVAAFDRWHLAGKVHKANFPSSQFFGSKLEDVRLSRIKKRLGKINLILASPECTSHSPAKGNKPRCEISRGTAFQVTRFARAFKPRWIVIENVVSMTKWSRYPQFKRRLQRLGYKVREEKLSAKDFGVPQSRRRLFLLCDRRRNPEPIKKPKLPKKPKASDAVDQNGSYSYSRLRTRNRARPTLQRANRAFYRLGRKKPFLLVYYGSDQSGGWQPLNRPLRTITTLDRFALVKPAPIRGHLMRMLQVPELQAAMGMNGMKFDAGTRREKIRMIGNAVCPPVMASVLRSLLRKRRTSTHRRVYV